MVKLTKREQYEALVSDLKSDEAAALHELKAYLEGPEMKAVQEVMSGFHARALPGGQFESILNNHSLVLGAVYQYVTALTMPPVEVDPAALPSPEETKQ